jgi:hypothetical protein
MKTIGLVELVKLLLLLWFVGRFCLSGLLMLVNEYAGMRQKVAFWLCLESLFVLILLGISGVTK